MLITSLPSSGTKISSTPCSIRSRKPLPKVTASPSSHDFDWPKGEVKHKTSPRHQRDLTFLYQIIIKKTLRCALLISYRVGKNYAIFRAPEVVTVVCQISAAACFLGSSASVFGSGVYQIPISIRPFRSHSSRSCRATHLSSVRPDIKYPYLSGCSGCAFPQSYSVVVFSL